MIFESRKESCKLKSFLGVESGLRVSYTTKADHSAHFADYLSRQLVSFAWVRVVGFFVCGDKFMARVINKDTGRVLTNNNREKQELWCHECRNYVQFPIDLSLNGNHVLNCPVCDHEHCRVVENGRITDVRWDSRNGPTWQIGAYASSTVSTISYSTASTGWGSTTATTWIAYT